MEHCRTVRVCVTLTAIACFFLFGYTHAQSTSADRCLTPLKQEGECIDVRKCEFIMNLFQNQTLDEKQVEYLLKSQCGFTNFNPKICCPLAKKEAPTNGNSDCFNTRFSKGRCVPIQECRSILLIIRDKPISKSDMTYLKDSQCGYENRTVKVCCPLDTVTETNKNKVEPALSKLLPDISVCGASYSIRIIGGTKAELDEFPWMALIEYKKPYSKGFHCGGVLINNRYVLTAAHCIKGRGMPTEWKPHSIRLGEYDLGNDIDCITDNEYTECNPPPIDIPIEEIIIHENYLIADKNNYDDIALIRLTRTVNYTDYIQPICLPQTQDQLQELYEGTRVVVSGWGTTEQHTNSAVKLKVQLPIKNLTQCEQQYSSANIKLRDTQMCAGGNQNKDTCRGDSGGPLMWLHTNSRGDANWFCRGIVSFGATPCGIAGWPGVYTKTANYMPWIISHMRQ